MIKHYTEKEVNEELKNLKIIADTREQKNQHILEYCGLNNIEVVSRKLDIGDYSAMLGDMTFERSIAIERKANLEELCANFAQERERFRHELTAARAFGTKIHLIIEDASWNDVFLGNYSSKLPAQSLVGTLLAWQVRYNVTVNFCKRQNTPRLIYETLKYAAKQELLYGSS